MSAPREPVTNLVEAAETIREFDEALKQRHLEEKQVAIAKRNADKLAKRLEKEAEATKL